MTEARATFADLVDEAAGGESVCITRHGRPVAVILGAEGKSLDEVLAVGQALDRAAEDLGKRKVRR